MQLDMSGSTALVSGSSGGLGRTIALELARHQADVVVNGLSTESGQRVVEEIEEIGANATFVRADINDHEEVDHLVDRAVNEFGTIDVLVASGAASSGPTADFFRNSDSADFLEHFLVGTVNRLYLVKAVLEPMIENDGGRIINITTDAGRIPTPGEVGPGSSAAAVMHATRTLADEFRRFNITVNSVALSVMQDTAFMQELMEESPISSVLEKAIEQQDFPLEARDAAEVVAFLAGAEGARPITGQTLSVTGGVGV